MVHLLLVCVLVVGLGTLVVLGLLVMVRDLFYESLFEAPSVTDEEAAREHTGDLRRRLSRQYRWIDS
jgi:hypothetical protein